MPARTSTVTTRLQRGSIRVHPSVLEETGSRLGFHITPPSHSPSCQAGCECPGGEPEAPPHQGLGAAWREPLLEQPTRAPQPQPGPVTAPLCAPGMSHPGHPHHRACGHQARRWQCDCQGHRALASSAGEGHFIVYCFLSSLLEFLVPISLLF